MKKGKMKTWDLKCDCGCGQKLRIIICKPLIGKIDIDLGIMKSRQKIPKTGIVLSKPQSIKKLSKIMLELNAS